jgi:hypothetical protein
LAANVDIHLVSLLESHSRKAGFGKIKEWILKCDKIRRLEPSEYYFDYLIGKAVERAKASGIKPLKFKDTLQQKCKALYDRLHRARSNYTTCTVFINILSYDNYLIMNGYPRLR